MPSAHLLGAVTLLGDARALRRAQGMRCVVCSTAGASGRTRRSEMSGERMTKEWG